MYVYIYVYSGYVSKFVHPLPDLPVFQPVLELQQIITEDSPQLLSARQGDRFHLAIDPAAAPAHQETSSMAEKPLTTSAVSTAHDYRSVIFGHFIVSAKEKISQTNLLKLICRGWMMTSEQWMCMPEI